LTITIKIISENFGFSMLATLLLFYSMPTELKVLFWEPHNATVLMAKFNCAGRETDRKKYRV